MVKYIKIISILIILLTLMECRTGKEIKLGFEKKISNLNPNDFPNLIFGKLYILEGIYLTKRDFEINVPKMDGTDSRTDYLYFYKNGKASFFVAENLSRAEFLIKQNSGYYNAIILKKEDEIIVERIQVFKMGGGAGAYRQKLQILNQKLYLQEGDKCYVYELVH